MKFHAKLLFSVCLWATAFSTDAQEIDTSQYDSLREPVRVFSKLCVSHFIFRNDLVDFVSSDKAFTPAPEDRARITLKDRLGKVWEFHGKNSLYVLTLFDDGECRVSTIDDDSPKSTMDDLPAFIRMVYPRGPLNHVELPEHDAITWFIPYGENGGNVKLSAVIFQNKESTFKILLTSRKPAQKAR